MAYREVGMIQVREIVRRWLAGDGLRSIARALGVDRKTVAEYVRLAHAAGIERDGAPPSEAQLDALAACRRPGRPVATTEPSAEVQTLIAQPAAAAGAFLHRATNRSTPVCAKGRMLSTVARITSFENAEPFPV